MSMDSTAVFQKIKDYADSSARLEKERLSLPISASTQQEYEAQLDKTVKKLQDQVKQHEAALQKLRDSSSSTFSLTPSSIPAERLKQIETIKSAYESLAQAEPSLPPADSPLPALLALRDTHQTITSSKAAIGVQKEKLVEKSKRLEHENVDLRDARLITDALERRIERLKGQSLQQKSSHQIAEDLIAVEQKRGKDMEKDVKKLTKALRRFIDHDLSAMLAAEELGGPTTGDMLDVDDEALEAGYTPQGRPKKPKSTRSSVPRDERMLEVAIRGKPGNVDSGQSKKETAAAEMHALLARLFAAVSDSTGSSAYVDLDRESAAARFLVRVKVAQFHPRNAQRIRLVEFGREIDG